MRRSSAPLGLVLGLVLAGAARWQEGPRGLGAREVELALTLSPLPPLPDDPSNRVADDPRAVRLGQQLFFDAALSANGALSCASCHDPARDLSDGKPLAEGLAVGTRRTPTLWNVAYQRFFFWDGRAATLWQQALGPLESELEMGGDRVAIARRLASEPELARVYESLFGALPPMHDATRFPARAKPMPGARKDPRHLAWQAMAAEDRAAIDAVFANVGKALAAYERRLVRVDAPFDRFVEGLRTGDEEALGALSDEAVLGLSLFLGKGRCRLCHVGPTFSDGEFHDLALPTPDGALPRDPGRYEGLRRLLAEEDFAPTGPHADGGKEAADVLFRSIAPSPERWGEFKTPSLRALARSGPFMHAGQFSSLREVLRFYSTREGAAPAHAHQELVLTPLELTEAEIDALLAFLDALQGRPREPERLAPPRLGGG